MKRLLATVAVALCASSPLAAQDAATVVARVNGTEITLGHLIAMRAMLPAQYQTLPDDVLFNGMLEQIIQQELAAATLRDTQSERIRIGMENEDRAFLAAAAIDAIAMEPLDEADILAEYEAIYGGADGQPEWNASHILVETEAEAVEIIAAIEGGADFAELAREKSLDPAGANGGQLGWFSAGMMVPEFEAAVTELEAGALSEPVQTQFGWHVVLLNETRLATPPTLEDTRGEIENALRMARVEERLQELTANAQIERPELDLDPALTANMDLLAN